jgi:hypothetical protein
VAKKAPKTKMPAAVRNGKPARKRVSAKLIRDTEDLPPRPPTGTFAAKPEPDDDEWGKDGLTHKQREFVKAYVGPAAGNASRAAEMAGYRSDNRESLRVTASENLTKPNVQRAVAKALARRHGGPKWTRAGLVEIARASLADFLGIDGQGKVKIDLRLAQAAGALGLLKKVRVRETDMGQEVTIETYDRMAALKTLAEMHGLLRPRDDDEKVMPQILFRPVNRATSPDADPRPN